MAIVEVTLKLWQVAHHPIPKTISGVGTVGGATASGWEAAGSVGGLISAAIALSALVFGIAWNNRQNRAQYNREIEEAKQSGRAEIERILEQVRVDMTRRIDAVTQDMYFWRGIALAHLQRQTDVVPIPPSEQPPHRVIPIPAPDEGGLA